MNAKIRGWINRLDWRVYAAIAITAAFLGLIVASYSSYQSEVVKNDATAKFQERDKQYKRVITRLDTSEKDVETLKSALDAQITQFEECKKKKEGAAGCKEPVVPTPSAVVEGPEGKQGPGPSALQVLVAARQAIIEFCANDRCKGDGGNTPTDAQLLSLITRVHNDYCAARNECRGADGTNGTNGTQGEEGPPGPTCPEGYTPEPTTLVTNEGQVEAIVCRAAPPPSEEN